MLCKYISCTWGEIVCHNLPLPKEGNPAPLSFLPLYLATHSIPSLAPFWFSLNEEISRFSLLIWHYKVSLCSASLVGFINLREGLTSIRADKRRKGWDLDSEDHGGEEGAGSLCSCMAVCC